MSRLIDADALIANQFKNDISYKAFVNLVKRQPTIEPERKTGKCIIPVPHDDVIAYSRAYWECDQCHKATYLGNEMNFCPNCGADMRGEQDGD